MKLLVTSLHNEHRILSRPLRLHWAGWETDTYRLQQNGWQLSAEQDVYQGRMRIAMSHDGMRMQAMTPRVDFDFERATAVQSRYHDDYLRNMVIPVQNAIARDLTLHVAGAINWSFQAIDATPTFSQSRIERMEDLCHFAAPLVRTQQIILPEESVPELMQRILKLQEPARVERIRNDMRNPEGLRIDAIPKQKFHAQILSLAA